ncbi:hypothetical protein [Nocardia asiatica]|uniref:hypothetical protein n=1 Tax=Nocardia asiatica TaxID=209252 RepID=UPI0012F9BD54|nr:hypothetical protein [Nocardia asiatica]
MTAGARSRTSSPRREDAHTFEVAGRVLSLLLDSIGPLGRSLGFHLWPSPIDPGFVLSWRGPVPGEIEVIQYLVNASADDELTTALRPGDVTFDFAADDKHYTHVDVQGVRFQLRPERMLTPKELASWGTYWRSGDLEALLS